MNFKKCLSQICQDFTALNNCSSEIFYEIRPGVYKQYKLTGEYLLREDESKMLQTNKIGVLECLNYKLDQIKKTIDQIKENIK